MAGLGALSGGNKSFYQCSDGKILQPLDMLHLLFPNEGPLITGDNVCFVPRPFSVPFLENLLPESGDMFTPHHLIDAILVLTLMGLIVAVGIILVKHVWTFIDPQFRQITPAHKQWYVVANMSKALFLFIMCFSTRYWIGAYKCNIQDDCQLIELKRCMMVYCATDMVALFLVPKLPSSTILHHISTTMIALVVCSVNLQAKGWAGLLGFCKMGCMYGTLSTVAFSVNAYLGLRVVYPKAAWMKLLCHVSLITYLLTIMLNWSTHLLWLLGYWAPDRDFSIFTILYIGMLYFLVRDDIVLVQWLLKQSSPMADNKKKQ